MEMVVMKLARVSDEMEFAGGGGDGVRWWL